MEAALKSAAHTLSAAYYLPLLAHACMEPMNCTADVKADGCALYVGTQVQQVAQVTAATAAGLAPAQVRVYTTLLGGGFGRRLDIDFIPAAVEASKALGVPVKVIWTREDDMTHDTYRPPAYQTLNSNPGFGKVLIELRGNRPVEAEDGVPSLPGRARRQAIEGTVPGCRFWPLHHPHDKHEAGSACARHRLGRIAAHIAFARSWA